VKKLIDVVSTIVGVCFFQSMSSHNIIESPPTCEISNPIINIEIEHFPIEDELSLSSSNRASNSLLLALSYYLVINQIWPQLQTPYPSLL
jgi:hypothetical protein